MLSLEELEQLTTFAEEGTLSQAAEKLHISQPTITRTMQHLEEVFGVPLFVRGKNRIALNETGKVAVDCSRQLLGNAREVLEKVQEYDRHLRTITVSSCAPAPLWQLLPALSSAFPGMTIASSLKDLPAVLADLRGDTCRLAVLPCDLPEEDFTCIPFLRENLFLCVPSTHQLARRETVSFSDLNGFNFLLRSEIGFWDTMCRDRMPSSRFLIQTDDFAFQELIRESALPCFSTDLAQGDPQLLAGRVTIPLSDPEAHVTYFLACRRENLTYMRPVRQIDGSAFFTASPKRSDKRF